MINHNELELYNFINKRRRKKVAAKYRLAFSIIFDKVTLFYLIPLLIIGILFLKNSINYNSEWIIYLNLNNFLVSTVLGAYLIVCYSFKAFIDPRYRLTSSEYNLTVLPYRINHIMHIIIFREQLKRLSIFICILTIVYILGVFNLNSLVLLLISFLISDLTSGLLQWLIFQKTALVKATLLTGVLLITILFLTLLMNMEYSSFLFWIFHSISILVIIIILKIDILKQVNWRLVVLISDDKTWNPFLVKLITGVGFNSISTRTRMSLPTNNQKKSKPLPYQLEKILLKYWKQSLVNNKGISFHLLSNGLAITAFLTFKATFSLTLGFTLASLIVTYLISNFLTEKLNQLNFKIIPWSLNDYVESIYKLTRWFIFILFVPQGIFLLTNISEYSLLSIGLVLVSEYLLSMTYLKNVIKTNVLSQIFKKGNMKKKSTFTAIMYAISLTFIGIYPLLSILAIMLLAYTKYRVSLKVKFQSFLNVQKN